MLRATGASSGAPWLARARPRAPLGAPWRPRARQAATIARTGCAHARTRCAQGRTVALPLAPLEPLDPSWPPCGARVAPMGPPCGPEAQFHLAEIGPPAAPGGTWWHLVATWWPLSAHLVYTTSGQGRPSREGAGRKAPEKPDGCHPSGFFGAFWPARSLLGAAGRATARPRAHPSGHQVPPSAAKCRRRPNFS